MSEDTPLINDGAPTSEQPAIKTGFVVLVDVEGNMYVERNKNAITGIEVQRDATLIEVRRYAQEIVSDLQAQASAEYAALRFLGLQEEMAKSKKK